jgi:hypothetical protein
MPDTVRAPAADYDEDFVAWSLDQAQRLRALSASGANLPLDLPHLAEEIEDLGKNVRNLCRNQVRRVIEHLLKLQCSPAAEPRNDWKASIVEARQELRDNLTATIQRDLLDTLPTLFADARRRAALGLQRFGETDAVRSMPRQCPWTLDDLLRDDWYPDQPDA